MAILYSLVFQSLQFSLPLSIWLVDIYQLMYLTYHLYTWSRRAHLTVTLCSFSSFKNVCPATETPDIDSFNVAKLPASFKRYFWDTEAKVSNEVKSCESLMMVAYTFKHLPGNTEDIQNLSRVMAGLPRPDVHTEYLGHKGGSFDRCTFSGENHTASLSHPVCVFHRCLQISTHLVA